MYTFSASKIPLFLLVTRIIFWRLNAKQYNEENIPFALETCISGHINNTEWIGNTAGVLFYSLLMSTEQLLQPLHNC